MKKRILSLLLILCMAVTLLPTAVFAEDATGETIPEGGAKIGDKVYDTLDKAMAAVSEGATATIYLGKGTYSSYTSTAVQNKHLSLTFIGAGIGETTWNIGTPDTDTRGQNNGDFSFRGNNKLVFRDMTLKAGVTPSGDQVTRDYMGFTHTNITVVEDCVIDGFTCYWGYESATFKNTTFNCPMVEKTFWGFSYTEGEYALWTYCSPVMTFVNCTFNSHGKVINVYTDHNAGKYDTTVNFEGCTVNNTSPNKAVLNINDSNMGGCKYILNISGDIKVSGVSYDYKTCSRLFGYSKKANNTGKTIVNFGNTTVWQDGKMVDAKAYHTDGVTVDGVTYNNDVAGANDSLYAEGYKDNEVQTTATDWAEQEDGSYTRTVTRKCNYCGYEEETTEIDWNVPKSIIAAACLNTKDHYSYLIGYSDGTVRPNGRITRAEVATIFFRLLTDDARQRNWSSENNFSDVSADKWYNNAVSTLCHMGVLGGYSDGTFRPNAPITRAEFAKIAVSFAQANGSAVYSYFTDVKTTDWFAPYVTAAKDNGLIEGYSDGSFKPENKITRAEACAIVNRVLGRKPSKSHMKISDRIDWPDCTTADWFYEAIMEATNSHTYQMGKRVETWNDKLPQRDWAELETGWASAYTGKGGEVH